MRDGPVVDVVRTMSPRRAWAVLVMTALSFSIALPTAVATHEVPGPDPVDPHDDPYGLLPAPPEELPETGAEGWTQGMETCIDTIVANFLAAIGEADLTGWLQPEEPYCEDQGDRIEATAEDLKEEMVGQIPGPDV